MLCVMGVDVGKVLDTGIRAAESQVSRRGERSLFGDGDRHAHLPVRGSHSTRRRNRDKLRGIAMLDLAAEVRRGTLSRGGPGYAQGGASQTDLESAPHDMNPLLERVLARRETLKP